ncbi:S8 family serine peptidase, partial [Candidatus Woesearchaeota archaeon]|nr:S8 family serine peptidase [Candidatus Woesearchaeota archaeon]
MKIEEYDTKSLVALALAIILFVAIFFLREPSITGRFTARGELKTISINQSFSEGNHSINLGISNPRGLKINAHFNGTGYAYGYIVVNNQVLRVFDTRVLENIESMLVGMVISNESINESNISIVMEKNISNTTLDEGENLSMNLSGNLNISGNISMNESLGIYLNESLNESLEKENISTINESIGPSRINQTRSNRSEKNILIEDECIDTCSFYADSVDKLFIVVVNGSLWVNNVSYTFLEQENHPPVMVKPIEDHEIVRGEVLVINLDEYFMDTDNDSLSYDAKTVKGLEININKNIVSIKALKQGSFLLYFYATDGKEVVKSNEFMIKVMETNISNITNITRRISLKLEKIDTRLVERIEKLREKERVRILVKTKSMDIDKNAEQLLKSKGISKKLRVIARARGYVAIEADRDTIAALSNLVEVQGISEDERVEALVNETKHVIRAVEAWNISNGEGARICILDTGIDPGVVSYSYGYDFVNNDSNPMDDNGHGTMIAYIAKSIAPGAEIIAVKVLNSSGEGYASMILQGIDYCMAHNASILSMSFGAGSYEGYCDSDPIAEQCLNESLICIAATGNDASSASIKAPACGSGVISVGATTKNDELASFSNINNITSLLAPGVDINTKTIGGVSITASGTSMAVPHVAGVVAMLKAINQSMNSSAIKERLMTTGKPILINDRYYSRIDAYNALINNVTMNITPINVSQENVTNETYRVSGGCNDYCNSLASDQTTCDSLGWVCNGANQLCHCYWDDRIYECLSDNSDDCSASDKACIDGISTTTHQCFECGDVIYNDFNLSKNMECHGDFLIPGTGDITIDCKNKEVNGSTNLIWDESFEEGSTRWVESTSYGATADRDSTTRHHTGTHSGMTDSTTITSSSDVVGYAKLSMSIEPTMVFYTKIQSMSWWVYLDNNDNNGGYGFELVVKTIEGREIHYCYDNGATYTCPSNTSTSKTISLTVPSLDTWTQYSRNLYNDWVSAGFPITDRINQIELISYGRYVGDLAEPAQYGQKVFWDDVNLPAMTTGIRIMGVGDITVKDCTLRGFYRGVFDNLEPYANQWMEILYNFNARTGTASLIDDYSFNQRNRTASGSPTYRGSLTGSGTGALSLDGSDDYIQLAASGSSSGFLHDAFSSRTVALWFKADDTSTRQTLFDEGGRGYGMAIRIYNNKLEGGVAYSIQNYSIGTSFTDTSNWHHVALVFNSGAVSLFLDGTLKGTTTVPSSTINAHSDGGGIGATISDDIWGDPGTTVTYFFDGKIDQFVIFDKALSADEIKWLAGQHHNRYENLVIYNTTYGFHPYSIKYVDAYDLTVNNSRESGIVFNGVTNVYVKDFKVQQDTSYEAINILGSGIEPDNVLLEDGVIINNGADDDLQMDDYSKGTGDNITILNVSLDKSS